MHRDVKVGLSLGILLVGIVGALCLRREPENKGDVPQLKEPGKLDEVIATKQNVPHLVGVEDSDNAPAPAPAKKESAKMKSKDGYQMSDLSPEDGAMQRELLSKRSPSAPDPIQPPQTRKEQTKPETAAAPIPAHNGDWDTPNSQKAKVKGAEIAKDATKPASKQQTHTIQPGDTLSSIAVRYLGSSSRYLEIYEANRTVLRSPNDLREGATLVIPASLGKTEAKTASSTMKEAPAESATTSNDRSDTTPRFTPVPRGTFSAGRIPPRTGKPSIPDRSSHVDKPSQQEKPPRIDIDETPVSPIENDLPVVQPK